MVLSKKKAPISLYIAIVLLCTIAMVTYTFPESLDITDYYEKAVMEAASGLDLKEYVQTTIAKYVDFIYHTILFLSVRNGIPMNLASIIILSVYYIAIIGIIWSYFAGSRVETHVFVYSILACPFIWVQEVPRTLTAIIFLYFAIHMLLKKHKKKHALLFLVLAFFSHAGSTVFFMICIIGGFLFKKLDISKTIQIVILIVVFLIALIAPRGITLFAMGLVSGMDNHYAVYSSIEIGGLFSYSSIGYGDRISSVMIYVYSLFLIFVTKQKDSMCWVFYSLCVFNTFCIVTNYSLFIRLAMILPLFLAYNAMMIERDCTAGNKESLSVISWIGLLVVFVEFYFYRNLYAL